MKILSLTIIFAFVLNLHGLEANDKNNCESCTTNCHYQFTSEGLSADLVWKDDKILEMNFKKTDDETIRISILGDGYMLYKETFKKGNDIKRIYDLHEFPEGKYAIRIQKGDKFFEKEIIKVSAESN